MRCSVCGAALSRDEVGLTKKLVNRGATAFLCYACLAAKYRVTVPCLKDMAEAFRASGCTLFA